jgi:hypothetical protein
MQHAKMLMRTCLVFCLMLGSPYWVGPGADGIDEILPL